MAACAHLLLLAALPALAGWGEWRVGGEVVEIRGEGAGPAFADRQRTGLSAPLGGAATLQCHVLRLGDKSVSWVRARDLQILSHAGVVFTADARVSARAAGGLHALRIQDLRAADAGRYECQVNTEPKLSLFFQLRVTDPEEARERSGAGEEEAGGARVEALGGAEVSVAAGASAALACRAHLPPAAGARAAVHWERAEGAGAWREVEVAARDSGAALETAVRAGRIESRLRLGAARLADAGAYRCVLRAPPAPAAAAELRLRVRAAEEQMETMQRDQWAGTTAGGPRPKPLGTVILSLVTVALSLVGTPVSSLAPA